MNLQNMNIYLQINVELPYLTFLRKIFIQQSADITDDGIKQIDVGFCMINKMKDIINLKRIFNNYGCYFSTHNYSLNMFKASLSSIKIIWGEICRLIEDVTLQALQTNKILKEQYLFILATQGIQDALMEFTYCSYFSKKINRSNTIKYIVLVKAEIKALEIQRKRFESQQEKMKCLLSMNIYEIIILSCHNYIISNQQLMSSRTVIGALSIFLFCNEFVSINRLPFDYHFHTQDSNDLINYKEGTFIISVKYFQHVLNKYDNPKIGDLVIVQGPDQGLQFRTVEALPQTQYSKLEQGFLYYVPNGFIVLKNPINGSTKMEFIANVRGNDHYALKW